MQGLRVLIVAGLVLLVVSAWAAAYKPARDDRIDRAVEQAARRARADMWFSGARADLRKVLSAEEMARREYGHFVDLRDPTSETFIPGPEVVLDLAAGRDWWTAVARDALRRGFSCAVFAGSPAVLPRTLGGVAPAHELRITCDDGGER